MFFFSCYYYFFFCLLPTNWFYAQFYCSTNINKRDFSRSSMHTNHRTSLSQCHKTRIPIFRTFTFYCVEMGTSNRALFTIWFEFFFSLLLSYSLGFSLSRFVCSAGINQNQHTFISLLLLSVRYRFRFVCIAIQLDVAKSIEKTVGWVWAKNQQNIEK